MTCVSSELLDQLPPCDLEAERGLLGAILVEASRIDAVAQIVTPADFHDAQFGRLFDSLTTLYEAGQPIGDLKTLIPALREINGAELGAVEIGKLIGEGISWHAEHYAHIIHRHSLRRRAIDMAWT